MARKILVNKARCKLCRITIESKHRHDFVSCPCGTLSVDGGREYIRRAWNSKLPYEDIAEELNEYEVEPTDKENQP